MALALIAIVAIIGAVAIGGSVTQSKNNFPPAVAVPADGNMQAMLATIRWSEGTDSQPDPYAVTFGYGHALVDLSQNPWDSGQMQGVGGPSGVTHACGAYQFEPDSFTEACEGAGISDKTFDPATQDQAAMWLIDVKRKAGDDVRAGRLADALDKLSWEWASLPPSRYKQNVRSYADLAGVFTQNGGVIA